MISFPLYATSGNAPRGLLEHLISEEGGGGIDLPPTFNFSFEKKTAKKFMWGGYFFLGAISLFEGYPSPK